jgi:CCAAT-binding transcription factor (CBF-B/NF-YA) subunit B
MQTEAEKQAHHGLPSGRLQATATTAEPTTTFAAMHPMTMPPATIEIPFQQHQLKVEFAQATTPDATTPVYVNRRQYRRILARRETRRVLNAYYERCRRGKKRGNPNYMHESRHRHAQNRPRNRKGHFMKGPELAEYYRLHPDKAPNNKKDISSTGSGP